MEILKISKTEKEAVVRLSAEEMKVICNVFYKAAGQCEGEPLYQLVLLTWKIFLRITRKDTISHQEKANYLSRCLKCIK